MVLLFHAVIAQNSNNIEFETIREKVAEQYRNAPIDTKKNAYLLKKLARTNEEQIIAYRYLGYIADLSGNVDSARYFFQKQLQLSKDYFLNKK